MLIIIIIIIMKMMIPMDVTLLGIIIDTSLVDSRNALSPNDSDDDDI